MPVYFESATTSGVLDRLKLGEEVCYVGERGEFAIIDWSKQNLIRGAATPEKEQAFARLVDLWPPRDTRSKGWGITDWWMRYGGTMDDPLGGLRGDPAKQ